MQAFIRAKMEKGKRFRFKESFPQGLRVFTAKKQIDYKIRKRLNSVNRHGYGLVKELFNDPERMPEIKEILAPKPNYELDSSRSSLAI